jgi:hypothetical protein
MPFACRGTEVASEIHCTCGQPAADIEGCSHPKCLAGERNPDNPECFCGTLSIPK